MLRKVLHLFDSGWDCSFPFVQRLTFQALTYCLLCCFFSHSPVNNWKAGKVSWEDLCSETKYCYFWGCGKYPSPIRLLCDLCWGNNSINAPKLVLLVILRLFEFASKIDVSFLIGEQKDNLLMVLLHTVISLFPCSPVKCMLFSEVPKHLSISLLADLWPKGLALFYQLLKFSLFFIIALFVSVACSRIFSLSFWMVGAMFVVWKESLISYNLKQPVQSLGRSEGGPY